MPHWVLDALLGSAVTLGITLIIATDPTADTRADPVAYLFAVGFGAARHHHAEAAAAHHRGPAAEVRPERLGPPGGGDRDVGPAG